MRQCGPVKWSTATNSHLKCHREKHEHCSKNGLELQFATRPHFLGHCAACQCPVSLCTVQVRSYSPFDEKRPCYILWLYACPDCQFWNLRSSALILCVYSLLQLINLCSFILSFILNVVQRIVFVSLGRASCILMNHTKKSISLSGSSPFKARRCTMA
jgi:hypothetical protein